ncbi:PD40 domain-containing protein [Neobacillus kokaensis]|uniref:Translocation protein TolB n=1 Tax=Neobacillus kokaensis TaxID=2759023 RepID=A0ABQ3NBD3_9BACI|nr:PD40 domain-containing protein [Neobacillus kokaensis]GHI01225.1 translocation protein TolB [Neobacillus kokaensis]
MLKKLFLVTIGIICFFSFQLYGSAKEQHKAAFIRNNDLWIKIGNNENQLTNGDYVRFPKWSKDGNWIAYLRGKTGEGYVGELWVYHVSMNKHFKVMENVDKNFQWSPRTNEISFMIKKDVFVLTVDPSKPFLVRLAAKTIENFSWLPKGDGLLVSKKKNQQLNSDILLFKVFLGKYPEEPLIKHFYTVPVGENEIVVSTSQFKWSHDQRWLSFLLIPTASLSADSNTLCILSSDGKTFRRIAEMLNDDNWFHWAPVGSNLGFISGIGREATVNKYLRIIHVPSFKKRPLTPKGYVERVFIWKGSGVLYSSRSLETTQGPLNQRPLPYLYKIILSSSHQNQIGRHPVTVGDFVLNYYDKKLYWVRTNRKTAVVMVGDVITGLELEWINNITLASTYYARWKWDEVFSFYGERNE